MERVGEGLEGVVENLEGDVEGLEGQVGGLGFHCSMVLASVCIFSCLQISLDLSILCVTIPSMCCIVLMFVWQIRFCYILGMCKLVLGLILFQHELIEAEAGRLEGAASLSSQLKILDVG